MALEEHGAPLVLAEEDVSFAEAASPCPTQCVSALYLFLSRVGFEVDKYLCLKFIAREKDGRFSEHFKQIKIISNQPFSLAICTRTALIFACIPRMLTDASPNDSSTNRVLA